MTGEETSMPTKREVTPAGFFALRTPLLPFDTLLAWGEGLAAPLSEPADLESALTSDRARLRADLRSHLAQPAVREAIFVASPDLYTSIERWLADPDSEKGRRTERALVRYFQRMAGRATPFGLFSGCSVGKVVSDQSAVSSKHSSVSKLTLASQSTYQRHTRLDMDYLFALTETLNRKPAIQRTLCYRPNSSLYRAAGRLRYAEARLNGKVRTYHLVAVEETDYLNATLARAQQGATWGELAAALTADDPDITLAEAEEYIGELIASQLLVSTLAPAVTGPEPIHGLIDQLRQAGEQTERVRDSEIEEIKEIKEIEETEGSSISNLSISQSPFTIANHLATARAALTAIDAAGLGAAPACYRTIAEQLAALPTPVELSRLFQIDMVKQAPQATLGKAVLAEIRRGVDLLHRIAGPRPDPLARFCEKFSERYEGREAPLVEALDDEIGIGFDAVSSADPAPLLDGLAFPPAVVEPTAAWGGREQLLLRKVAAVWRQGAQSMELTAEDLAALENKQPLPLPDSLAVTAMLAAPSDEALGRGEFRILLEGVSGPSGARLLGRFCHGDPALHHHVEQHLAAEEAMESDALFAEVVHLPEGRIGNVLCRPVLRRYEIPYLGQSGADPRYQIPITDLMVSVKRGKVVLRSQRLGRRVIPRLTTAHNYLGRNLGIYQFLCSLQNQGVAAGLRWDWGALDSADFLPRVTHGRLVLARARWRVGPDEIRTLTRANGVERYRAVQAWRSDCNLPRFVLLVEYDNLLPVDLDNIMSIDAFLDELKGRTEAMLVEMFPSPNELCARDAEGRFVHEIIVPFIHAPATVKEQEAQTNKRMPPLPPRSPTPLPPYSPIPPLQRTFPPGSEWLYAKLYTGAATADQVLCEVVGPVAQAAMQTGAADRWFFIRYSDPDWHLRVRFHGEPERLHAELLPTLQNAAAPLLTDGRLWRVQLDTYAREVERYGGAYGIELAERLFHADSESVLAIVQRLDGDAGADARWRLTLAGMDQWLTDLGLDLAAKQQLAHTARESFMREFQADSNLRSQLGEKQRNERNDLEAMLDARRAAQHPLADGLALLQQRSAALAPILCELRAAERAGHLAQPLTEIAWSLLHMHANRLLRSNQRAQELVLYHLLDRIYQSQIARQRQS
jgi:thiopeptide-type bacteriocin biosynthesis protein